MNPKFKADLAASIEGFHLPRYDELPDDGLYLEQTTKYVADVLRPLQENAITASMISNYVKKNLVNNPIRKQYFRDQISHLIFIAVAKIVLSMDDIRLLIGVQKRTYSAQVAYDYFCTELENVLAYIFGQKTALEDVTQENTDGKKHEHERSGKQRRNAEGADHEGVRAEKLNEGSSETVPGEIPDDDFAVIFSLLIKTLT